MTPTPELKPGCLIRHRYKYDWEYAVWNGNGTFTVLCSQTHLNEWKNGKPIEKLIYCDNEDFQKSIMDYKMRLRDGTNVIEITWKGTQANPKKTIRP